MNDKKIYISIRWIIVWLAVLSVLTAYQIIQADRSLKNDMEADNEMDMILKNQDTMKHGNSKIIDSLLNQIEKKIGNN